MRIGIDVGGTNTDAVLMDGNRVLAEVKTPTTSDVTAGIRSALDGLLGDDGNAASVQAVMIGTTHFTNAVVEAKRLVPTAAVRLGLPATRALRPMVDWPARLRDAIGGHVYMCHGGHEYDGRPISPVDPAELRAVATDIRANGIRSIAISSVFSPVNAEVEQEAAELFAGELGPDIPISLSHELGRVGLLERENATIMNACLRELAVQIVAAFSSALEGFGIDAPVYLSQNDGTLMGVDFAERYPVLTFASGPTNSMRGAAFLSGLSDCAVVDIGGTTSDIGILQRGFPREASTSVDVGGVRTNFRMPDVLSLGIGGGSIVRADGELSVGPDSVGYELTTKALVFGGDTLTATDVVVASGRADLGDRARASELDDDLVADVSSLITARIGEAIDRMKTSSEPIPVVVVGGGSILIDQRPDGVDELVKPDHYAVANAIGAAIAQIGGEVDRIFALDELSRDEALEQAKREASEKAIAAGAQPESVTIVDVEEVPLAYLPSNAARIRVKAVGELVLGS